MTSQIATSDVDVAVAAAVGAEAEVATAPVEQRALWLEAVADALEQQAAQIVPAAEQETRIPAARLHGELSRTSNQLRMFATVIRDGSYLEAMVDRADPSADGAPRPDVRRLLVPLGPVAVFSASNFPFAFSVAGGDTASALAAGCPVVVKAHPGHPRLSNITAEVARAALAGSGAPDGTIGLVHGLEAGRALVTAPAVRAVGFTGSLTGGRALFDLATNRPDPIPFYGELGSLNPVYVTAKAVAERGDDIATGFVASYTLGAGQLCTKPGIVFVPAGGGIAERAAELVGEVCLGPLLNSDLESSFRHAVARLRAVEGVHAVAGSTDDSVGVPVLLRTDVAHLLEHRTELLNEAFGPASLIVEYKTPEELAEAAAAIPGSLTASLFADGDEPELPALLTVVQRQAGRLIWNGWPTGVAVTWAMHHGGPFPATTSPLHTSVGATAIGRWLRPVAFQNWPQQLLPAPLKDGAPGPVRVDGALPS